MPRGLLSFLAVWD